MERGPLARHLFERFTSAERASGRALFGWRRVQVLGGNASIAGARVRMLEHAHVVVVALRGAAAAVRCTCSSFAAAGRCAHAWAAVLAMDERKLPSAAHEGEPPRGQTCADARPTNGEVAGFVELRVGADLERDAEGLADAVVHALGPHLER